MSFRQASVLLHRHEMLLSADDGATFPVDFGAVMNRQKMPWNKQPFEARAGTLWRCREHSGNAAEWNAAG